MNFSLNILKKYWGYETFRPGQEAIVEDAINGHDVLALMPTGGGKSICFQVPGMAREGITIVISPLIALMQDQVNNLLSKNIPAKAITGGMSYRELDIVLDNAKFNGYKFLYTSPERIQSSLFIERFKQMNVALIVVDEAHCISEWGHDFRPSFMEIKKLREIHPHVPMIALTATATPKTKEEIIEKLELKNVKIHQSKFERPNLVYKSINSHNKIQDIITVCQHYGSQTGIVYCQTRKSVKQLAKTLSIYGISTGIYHGGMNGEERKTMLNAWLKNELRVMVATNAFGMGIDKPDVRFVAHYEFPLSLEAYFQEAGRGGRDGKTALAINFMEDEDFEMLERKLEMKYPPLEEIKRVYRAICNFLKIAIGSGKDESYDFNLTQFCQNFDIPAYVCYSSLKILELMGELTFSESFFHPTKVKFAIGNPALYNFQIQNEKYYPITTLLARSYPGIFDNFYEIDEKEFCKRLNINKKELENQLKYLENWGILDIDWKSDSPKITFLRERMPYDYLEISPEIYHFRKEIAYKKLEAVEEYLFTENCRSEELINYFGIESSPCGRCDNCINNQQKQINQEYKNKIKNLLENNTLTLEELKIHFSNQSLFKVILRELLKLEIIQIKKEKYQLC